MKSTTVAEGTWVPELVNFLRTQPGVSAVRVNPSTHKVAVATFGEVDLALLGEQLAQTIAAVEARLASMPQATPPAGFSLKRTARSSWWGAIPV